MRDYAMEDAEREVSKWLAGDSLRARVEALEAENERLRRAVEIVREHQYADSFSTCYDCGWAADGHADDCWIARALRVAEGEEQ